MFAEPHVFRLFFYFFTPVSDLGNFYISFIFLLFKLICIKFLTGTYDWWIVGICNFNYYLSTFLGVIGNFNAFYLIEFNDDFLDDFFTEFILSLLFDFVGVSIYFGAIEIFFIIYVELMISGFSLIFS